MATIGGLSGGLAWATSGGPAPLPYQAAPKHLGVASCASSVCHGAVTASAAHDVRLDEFVTWSHEDKHAQAYAALSSEKGRAIAEKLGIADARTEKACLDCHSDNVPAAQRGSGFTVADGVGCEACHGGGERWLASHSSREATFNDNIARGMYPTARLPERVALCISCHYGNDDKFATHRMMGAGHPRLAFELDTFLALQPPHYRVDADYQKRKPTYSRAQVWAYGQLALLQRELGMLQGPLLRANSFIPEFALLDCHACHENPLHRLDWHRHDLTRLTQPGSVPFPKGHLEMAAIIAGRIDQLSASEITAGGRALERAAGENREQIIAAAGKLSRTVERVLGAALVHHWDADDTQRMLTEIVQRGGAGEYSDYISAEQAVMAIDVMMIDIGVADLNRPKLDELYRIVRDDDAYDPSRLRDALNAIR
jgi:hypothetical protein